MSKYHSQKTVVNGEVFDSKRESNRYLELCMLVTAGLISELERQNRFLLIPEAREPETIGKRGGVKKGKLIERACYYTADFTYYDTEHNYIVEDCKGFRTKEYLIKRKLMLHKYGIRIKET